MAALIAAITISAVIILTQLGRAIARVTRNRKLHNKTYKVTARRPSGYTIIDNDNVEYYSYMGIVWRTSRDNERVPLEIEIQLEEALEKWRLEPYERS